MALKPKFKIKTPIISFLQLQTVHDQSWTQFYQQRVFEHVYGEGLQQKVNFIDVFFQTGLQLYEFESFS
jgi:hypothetical protein